MSVSLDAARRDLAELKLSLEEQSTHSNVIAGYQEILIRDVASLKQEVQDLKHTSYDGTLI